MRFKSFFKAETSVTTRRQSPGPRLPPVRLGLEPLEGRDVPSYSVIDLGTLGGVTTSGSSTATDVNASGQVVGGSFLADGTQHAFLWHQGQMIDLGTLGGSFSEAAGINDAGQIVGRSYLRNNQSSRAFLLTPEDADGNGIADRWFRDSNADGANDLMRDLGTLGGSNASSAALDVNNLGQVVGVSSWQTSSGYSYRAVLWQQGLTTTLGVFSATAINDAGVVVGRGYSTNGNSVALVWNNGTVTNLGFSDGAADVNDSGQLVDSAGVARLWTPTQPNGTTGTFANLETTPPNDANLPYHVASYSSAVGLNNAGAVVGERTDWYLFGEEVSLSSPYAVVWKDGQAEVLPLDTAASINDDGRIVGTRNGRAALLIPQTGDRPQITAGGASVTEGNSGTAVATFTVTLSAASSDVITVAYATANGTATAGSDYEAQSGTLAFAPGETTKTITVLVKGDRIAEPNETFVVNLSNATNATIATSQGVGTVLDDEPRISISDVSKQEGKKGQTTVFTFTVTLSAAYDQPVTMSFRTANGTATTSNSDYVARSGTVTFAPGETTKTITVEVKGDSKRESNEYFYLDLSSNSSNSWFAKNRGIGTILNDD